MNSFGSSPADSLNEEQKAVRALTQLLQQEQEQLVLANMEGVADLTAPKAKAAAQVAELAKQRYRALSLAGFEATEGGMKVWAASEATSETAKSAWRELIELAQAAQEINRVNGTLINKQIVRNQNVLNVLQSGSIQGNNTYGPNGQTNNSMRGRHIAAG